MNLRDLPPLAALRAFAALAETRSVSAAGALLNVSHAAVSQQIRALEAHLGLKLVTRDGRGIALTPQGAQLGDTVREAFQAIGRQIDEMTGADADRPVQVTTTPTFAASWLMPRMGDFRIKHPEIDLLLNPTADVVELAPGGIDLAIRFGAGAWPGYDARLLVRTPFVVAAAVSLIGATQIDSPADLLQFPWLQEIGTEDSAEWLARHGVTGTRVKGMTRVPGNLLLEGIRSGQGVAATTRAAIEADVAQGRVRVLFEEDTPHSGYYIVTRPGPLRPAAKTFATWLRRQIRGTAGAV